MSKIPKIFWQTYKTHQVPVKWEVSPISIKQLHPNWKYHLTDDQQNRDFISIEYPQYLQLYDRLWKELKPIASVDMVRYLLLHKYGGVYLDLDYKIIKCLDTLFLGDNELYLVRTPNWGGGYTNSFMASAPGCSFWIKCIEQIKYRLDHKPWYIFGDIKVLWTTGPGMLTDTLSEYTLPYVTIPYKLGHPCNICDHYLNRINISEDSYVEELEGSSWTNWSTEIFYSAVCRWREFFFILIIIIILLITLYFAIKNGV